MKRIGFILFLPYLTFASLSLHATEFDVAPFSRACCIRDAHTTQVAFDYGQALHVRPEAERTPDGRFIYGLQWAEARDIRAVRVRFRAGESIPSTTVEYWFREWPYPPPRMPTIEDPEDDPWQGKWLRAATKADCHGVTCQFAFAPLTAAENPKANNMPGVDYRRTLKLRLVFASEPALETVEVFTGSQEMPLELRMELGAGETAAHTWEGRVRVYNGRLTGLRLWKGSAADSVEKERFRLTTGGEANGLILNLVAAEPSLPGSEDITIVTVEAGERTFSFATPDVEKGPVYVPEFHAYVTLARNEHQFSPSIVRQGERIREKLATEPEQTYERAAREIPALDPVERQGGRLYLPLAADASWQKFAFEWGGNITISKGGTKAKGAELGRLEWPGDRISWRIGTGARPTYRPASADSKFSVLENCLPVVTARWTTDGIDYSEEGFATLLSGPLAPDDPQRTEQTPAVLMLKITARNPGASAATAHVWLATDPGEEISFGDGELATADRQLVRARLRLPGSAAAVPADVPDGAKTLHGIHAQVSLQAGEAEDVFLLLPFIPRLSPTERARLASHDYGQERARVVDYWRRLTAQAVPFDLPESRFVSFAQALIPHIRISATKDPKSGLYMIPAASYGYPVYDNEAAYQCVLLDALGDHALAGEYLESFLRLQGSRPMDGTFVGEQSAVYHGARVDEDYDYTAAQYNLDHGTVLWALAEHYFLARDREWLRRAAPGMKRAADWVATQRKVTELLDAGGKIPEYGLLPAGHLEDNGDWGHWFSVNALAAAGMTRLAQALADTDDPSAALYAQEAATYTQDLRDAVRRAVQLAPVIRLRDNTYVPYVPTRPYLRIRHFGPLRVGYYSRYPEKALPTYRLSATREVLYGPMLLLSTDVFRSDEPLANWVLDDWEDNATMSTSLGLFVHGWVEDRYWFSRGGMVFQANLQNPVLAYLRRNEIPAAIRNLYNDFVSCYYPDVNVFTEEYRQWGSPSGPFYKVSDEARFVNRLRDLLVREDGETLWLAAGVPRRWWAPGKKIEDRNAATYFGPVSFHTEATEAGAHISIDLPARDPYKAAWLVVRAPESRPLQSVEIDGQPWRDFDSTRQRIRLPLRKGRMEIEVHF